MKTVAFFDAKAYDKESFSRFADEEINIRYFENKLNTDTVSMAACCDGVCAFVNDTIDKTVIDRLSEYGVGVIAMRCAGYNNVDLKAAAGRVKILRVPAYSPYSVAEHAMGLILTLNRKLHRAYIRTRDHNFSLEGLIGFDLKDKTVGIIGTGKIGRCFAEICKGVGEKRLHRLCGEEFLALLIKSGFFLGLFRLDGLNSRSTRKYNLFTGKGTICS